MLDDVWLNVGKVILNSFSTSSFSNCHPFHTCWAKVERFQHLTDSIDSGFELRICSN